MSHTELRTTETYYYLQIALKLISQKFTYVWRVELGFEEE